jgi:trehalose 6-phosphate synthase
MPEEERRRRMRKMREVVEEHNVYRWAGKILSTLLKLEPTESAPALADLALQLN